MAGEREKGGKVREENIQFVGNPLREGSGGKERDPLKGKGWEGEREGKEGEEETEAGNSSWPSHFSEASTAYAL